MDLKKVKKITGLVTMGLGVAAVISSAVGLFSLSFYQNAYFTAQGDAKKTSESLNAYAEKNELGSVGLIWAQGLGQAYDKSGSEQVETGRSLDSSWQGEGAAPATISYTTAEGFFYDEDNDGVFEDAAAGPNSGNDQIIPILPEVEASLVASDGKIETNPNINGGINNDTNGDGYENVADLIGVANIPEYKIETNKGSEFEEVVPAHVFTAKEAQVWSEFLYDGLSVATYASTEAFYELKIPALVTAVATLILTGISLFAYFGLAITINYTDNKEGTQN